MNTFSLTVALFIASCLLMERVVAQSTATPVLPLTAREQTERLGQMTKAEELDSMRDQVREGRYGQRGLNNLFRNFEGEGYIDPMIPGITKNLSALNSLSWQQAKGAARTLLYATKVYQDPRFQLVAVDQPVNAPYGRTDKDLVLRDKLTGQRSRIEVKDVKPASQRADLERIKGQIDKMLAEYRQTGELPVWVNRRETIPAIKEYARQNGIAVYDNIPAKDFHEMILNRIKTASELITQPSLLGGAGEMGIGIWMLAKSAPETLADLEDVLRSDTHEQQDVLRLGEHGTMSLSSISVSGAGAARVIGYSRLVSNVRTLNGLGALSKWGGRAGAAFFLISEGFVIAEWQGGGLNDRQFYTIQGGLGGGLAGGAGGTVVGAWIGGGMGAVITSETGGWGAAPGATIGGFLGGLAGGVGGSSLGAGAVDRIYQSKDEGQKAKIQNVIYQHYGVSR
jgi:hypothetical protein